MSAPKGKIDINRAGVKEIQTLDGIGPVLADRIYNYKIQKGPFKKKEDLLKVPGIGSKTFQKIKSQITLH